VKAGVSGPPPDRCNASMRVMHEDGRSAGGVAKAAVGVESRGRGKAGVRSPQGVVSLGRCKFVVGSGSRW
jgi:hypothetical protein